MKHYAKFEYNIAFFNCRAVSIWLSPIASPRTISMMIGMPCSWPMTRGHMLAPRNSTLDTSWLRVELRNLRLTLAISGLALADGDPGIIFEPNVPQYLPRSSSRRCLDLYIYCNITRCSSCISKVVENGVEITPELDSSSGSHLDKYTFKTLEVLYQASLCESHCAHLAGCSLRNGQGGIYSL